jgi:hypothetical protein
VTQGVASAFSTAADLGRRAGACVRALIELARHAVSVADARQLGARFIDFPAPAGIVRIKTKDEWVTPTGGGYFFAPSISAIRDVLAA